MNSVGDAFAYPFRDPGWAGKIAVQALILIIPIVGWIAGVGWLRLTYQNLRAGRQELAPAGFYLEEGIGLFGVYAIYYIVANIPGWILDGIGRSVARATDYSIMASPFSGLGSLWQFLASLLLDFLAPTLIIVTVNNGFAAGLDVQRVWATATRNMNSSIIGGLVIFAGGIIGALGLIACCIGVFFTAIYSAAITAGVAAWFERMQSAPAAPGAPAA